MKIRTTSVSVIGALLLISGVLMTGPVPPAQASHSLAGGTTSEGCGSHAYNTVTGPEGMTKGRTDGMVVSASYSTGCKSYSYKNLIGTSRSESYGYPGQKENCVRVGQTDVARFFEFYFDTEIDPQDVKVSCSAYRGDD